MGFYDIFFFDLLVFLAGIPDMCHVFCRFVRFAVVYDVGNRLGFPVQIVYDLHVLGDFVDRASSSYSTVSWWYIVHFN